MHSPLIEQGHADVLVALEWNEGLRALRTSARARPLIVNLHRVVPPGACRDRLSGGIALSRALPSRPSPSRVGDVRACDATAIAGRVGSAKPPTAYCSACSPRSCPSPTRRGVSALADHAPRGTAPANEAAFRAGRALRYPDETHAQAAAARMATPGPGLAEHRGPATLEIVPAWCKGRACAICVRACPERCLDVDATDTLRVIRPEACTGCRLCELLCPDFAVIVHAGVAG